MGYKEYNAIWRVFFIYKIAKYSFLDATVDVKGTAYETIVSNTLKQEAGQFLTPRNIIKVSSIIQFILLYQTAELFNCPICEL